VPVASWDCNKSNVRECGKDVALSRTERERERERDPDVQDWQESLDVRSLLLPFISHDANRAGNRLLGIVNAN